ncbi:uncharacterized protein LOC121420756 [Lytechinus variegatus]|uniref:uncharacterized protein LOC121420756 n=1 Tax=Lytechinus variegatus TaxID=7654 RepID=UPI001BB0E83E|nr:uncharacterized protein LOC121420756 [Lytechinus variegatus]
MRFSEIPKKTKGTGIYRCCPNFDLGLDKNRTGKTQVGLSTLIPIYTSSLVMISSTHKGQVVLCLVFIVYVMMSIRTTTSTEVIDDHGRETMKAKRVKPYQKKHPTYQACFDAVRGKRCLCDSRVNKNSPDYFVC